MTNGDDREYRYSDRGVIRVGEVFRASGGPTYGDKPVGYPGRYRLRAIERKRGRVWLEAVPVDRAGDPLGGVYLLPVEGKPRRPFPELPDWIVRPYRVAAVRQSTLDRAAARSRFRLRRRKPAAV